MTHLSVSDEDYEAFDNWTEGAWFISEWEFHIVPPGHWLHEVVPPGHPDLRSVTVQVGMDEYSEPVYLTNGHCFDTKEAAFAMARSVARLQYGSAIRQHQASQIAAEQRAEYERRREQDRTSSMANVLVDMLTNHPEILDSYRDSAPSV